jgi:hypothetical protein
MAENLITHAESYSSHHLAAEALLARLAAHQAEVTQAVESVPRETIETSQVGGAVPTLEALKLQAQIATGGNLKFPDKLMPVIETHTEAAPRTPQPPLLLIKAGLVSSQVLPEWEKVLREKNVPYRIIEVATRANTTTNQLEYLVTLDGQEIQAFPLTDRRIQKHQDDDDNTIEAFSPTELAYVLSSFPEIEEKLGSTPSIQVVLGSARGVSFSQAVMRTGLKNVQFSEDQKNSVVLG